jgi:hypothetical protein
MGAFPAPEYEFNETPHLKNNANKTQQNNCVLSILIMFVYISMTTLLMLICILILIFFYEKMIMQRSPGFTALR